MSRPPFPLSSLLICWVFSAAFILQPILAQQTVRVHTAGVGDFPVAPTSEYAPAENSLTDTNDYLNIHRRQAVTKLLHDPRAPLDSISVTGLRYFPRVDELRFVALFRPAQDSTNVNFPTSDGRVRTYRSYGQVLFKWQDTWHTLTVYEMPGMANHPVYCDHLFLPFTDLSNGETSYGGGRYLDLFRSRIDSGDYTLDFNLAYNPWCAYADGFSCPMPPSSNRLDFAVHAGEAAFVTLPAPTSAP